MRQEWKPASRSIEELQLHTERLVLRPIMAGDFDAWAAFYADEDATRHLGGPRSRAMAWRHFLAMAGAWRILGYGPFSLIEKSTRRWIGYSGPWHPVGWPGPEVGWCIARETWGKGYAVEGASAAIGWAFAQLDWSEVVHCIPVDNLASQAVARRLGSTVRERITMPEPFAGEVVDLWAQTREQWRERRS